ncbi:MAG TPA: GH25 family lysozyme [Stellaceae bacterium]|nr:GH25 family lysozyme [Stellaceae bacterium]
MALVALGAAVYFFTYSPDRGRFPLRGIDVSHHQGAIDWDRVRGDDVAFVYVKATEGAYFVDPRFAANWQGARRVGLPVGAYHFFNLCRPGRDQARNFLAVDLELGGNCVHRPAPEIFAGELSAFVTEVEREQGREVIFYVTRDFLAAYGRSLPPRAIWRRSILREPTQRRWTLWQYRKGIVADVDGLVDLNVFYADAPSFAIWAGRPDSASLR